MLIIFVLSFPVLIGLLVSVVVIFMTIDGQRKKPGVSPINRTLLGFANGASITIINILYTNIARWFVNFENHKYTDTYEYSLIMKSFAFKFLNSFLAIFYFIFTSHDANLLQSIFETVLPVLFYKQVSNILEQVGRPYVIYRFKQKKYFDSIHKKAVSQETTRIYRQYSESKEKYQHLISHEALMEEKAKIEEKFNALN